MRCPMYGGKIGGRMPDTPDDSSELPFVFDHVQVSSQTQSCGVLVMTPREPTVFGAQRRAAVEGTSRISPVEQKILAAVEARPSNTPILILRGGIEDGTRLWSFDPDFDEEELEETGRVFSRSVMPLYREFLARGVVLFAHSDWGYREIGPIRRGLDALGKDLHLTGQHPAVSAVDEWIIRNMLLYSSLSLRHVLDKLLPPHLSLLARREQGTKRMLGRLPPGTLV